MGEILDQLFPEHPLWPAGQSWPSQWQVSHGDPARLPALLQAPLLNDFNALAERYRGPLSFGRGLRSPQTFESQANAAHLLGLGLTVYLQNLLPCLEGASAFVQQLEAELGVEAGSIRFTGFASPADDGVSLHYDAEEVISIQLQGRKRFLVGQAASPELPYGSQYGPQMVVVDSLYAQARDGFPEAAQVTFDEVLMVPGSVLYLPRGTWHRTYALSDSFSVSLVLRPPVLFEALLRQLREHLLGQPAWRVPVYGQGRGALEQAHQQGLVEQLGQQLQAAGQQLLTQGVADPSQRSLALHSRLLRVPTSSIEFQPEGKGRGRLQVQALDQRWQARITLDTLAPLALAELVEWIAGQGMAFDVGQVLDAHPRISASDCEQLLRLLLQAHALRHLADPWPLLAPEDHGATRRR